MILYTTNILLLPFAIVIWAIDAYLLLTLVRCIGGRFTTHPAVGLTDRLPDALGRWIAARRQRPLPTWVPWAAVIGSLLIVRHLLIALLVAAI